MLGLVALIDRADAPECLVVAPTAADTRDHLGLGVLSRTVLLGMPLADVPTARLLGERVILTEVVAYQEMARLASAGAFADPRSVVILSYALCGSPMWHRWPFSSAVWRR